METFEVPTRELKSKWLKYADEHWRAFKTSLGVYIFGDLQGILPYVDDYMFLGPDTWKAFVASCQIPEFLAKTQKAQEIQSNNKCPHRLSHGGFKNLKNKSIDEKFRARREASLDPSVVISPPSLPSRHEICKRARINPKGNHVSKDARVIAEKIDFLKEHTCCYNRKGGASWPCHGSLERSRHWRLFQMATPHGIHNGVTRGVVYHHRPSEARNTTRFAERLGDDEGADESKDHDDDWLTCWHYTRLSIISKHKRELRSGFDITGC
ncbi:hypothetical protein OROMI_005989 [Orobanche minor]